MCVAAIALVGASCTTAEPGDRSAADATALEGPDDFALAGQSLIMSKSAGVVVGTIQSYERTEDPIPGFGNEAPSADMPRLENFRATVKVDGSATPNGADVPETVVVGYRGQRPDGTPPARRPPQGAKVALVLGNAKWNGSSAEDSVPRTVFATLGFSDGDVTDSSGNSRSLEGLVAAATAWRLAIQSR